MDEDALEQSDKLIIRRYEFYEYTGQYDEEHEPITLFLDPGDLLEPPEGELGNFISSNMAAAVIGNVVPEQSTTVLGLIGVGWLLLRRNRPLAVLLLPPIESLLRDTPLSE